LTVDVSGFASLLDNADPGPLDRGQDLAGRDVVSVESVSETEVQAWVQGTIRYRVTLQTGERGSWSCECPAAANGSFCKHCVAVAMVLTAPANSAPTNSAHGPSDAAPSEAQRIEQHVRSLDAEALAEIVLEQASIDEQLSYRLLAAASAEAGEKLDLREWKKRVTAAFRGRGGFIEWRHAPDWARGVHDMLDVLVALLAAGYAAEVAALAEHAHRRAESAVNRVDDSGGEIIQIVSVLREIHLAAAEAGAYAPKKLGKRLADLEVSSSLDTFHRSAIDYGDVLGADGLDAYRAVVEKAHAKLGPDADRWGPASRIRNARIAHAIATFDPDRLIEIYEDQEQMWPSDYVELVDLMQVVSRVDEAEDWADRGLAEHKGHPGIRPLREAKATLIRGRSGDWDEIEKLFWEEFLRRPSRETVRSVLANCEDAAVTRDRVIAKLDTSVHELRDALAIHEHDVPFRSLGTSSALPGSVGAPPRYLKQQHASAFSSAAIIEVFIDLDEIERAWSLALEFGASPRHWADLVERRADDHPGDAVEWALVAAEIEIDHKSRKNYRRAVRHLQAAQALATQHDSVEDGPLSRRLDVGVDAIAKEHSSKRALLDELAKGGWQRVALSAPHLYPG